jgi:hypothetical protein
MIRIFARIRGPAALTACVLALAAPSAVLAGDVADAAARAERFLDEGKTQEAIDAFAGATDAFWRAMPLAFSTVAFAEQVRSYGDFSPLAAAQFRAGEAALVYLEPVGFEWMPEGNAFLSNLEADLEIRSPSGLIFGKAEKFATFARTSRHKSRELDLRIRVALPELKPGSYELLLTLRDTISGKTASASLPFTLVE